ncbi:MULTISPECIES: monovalent cation/H(+) antiporter subunit G [unclassified Brevundimonas]|uniref:monovalent cation/H(+) antiporter subunit G n=1 Tax=unclassified Brevundimonas TaxID=2622653 RepID=UPI0025BA7395|nr:MULTISPECIES: monovalent cation/H(+) antiporter subunit G [unclassified Brevundimonas]
MTAPANLPDIPMWAAIVVTALCLLGAFVALLGSVGLRQLPNMYERIHAPTMTSTLGVGAVIAAMIVYFSHIEGFTLKALLVGIFVLVTTPVTMVLLARASLYRDRVEGNDGVPKDDL